MRVSPSLRRSPSVSFADSSPGGGAKGDTMDGPYDGGRNVRIPQSPSLPFSQLRWQLPRRGSQRHQPPLGKGAKTGEGGGLTGSGGGGKLKAKSGDFSFFGKKRDRRSPMREKDQHRWKCMY